MKAGKYGFIVEYADLGMGEISDLLTVTAGSTYTAANVQTSYLGGILTVTGTDISEQAVLKIGGMRGKVKEVRAGEADIEIPPLLTPEVITAYP